jgi:23S rRNA-/tRNA-specific pseudouridylate synthase
VFQLLADEPVSPTCIEELIKRLGHVDPSSWQSRFDLGGVYLAGRPAKPTDPVRPPCRLEYYEPRFNIERATEFFPQFRSEMILELDQDFGVAVKPAGLPTTPTRDQSRFNFQGYLSKHLGEAVHTPSRLDTGVSGLLLFSRSARMNRALQNAYEQKRVHKVYLALLSGSCNWRNYDVTHRIDRDDKHPVLQRVVEQGGELAHTRFTTLYTGENQALVVAQPLTGRTHQIRVHCAAEGKPIRGDPYYGGVADSALHLVSYGIRFFHPFHQEYKTYVLPQSWWPEWLGLPGGQSGALLERLYEIRPEFLHQQKCWIPPAE